ncbi:MAG: ABC transporter substrate-binding protein [Proteobacteria bacterium]|nr:ABC transporter substrate-binding protein [Pseudomonadota bacterium]
MLRRSLPGLVAIVILIVSPWAASSGRADIDNPRAFVQTLGSEAIEMLSNPSLSEADRTAEFRRILVGAFDLRSLGRFILGRHWRRATPDERKEFDQLFEDYVVATYASRLGQYHGETLIVGEARSDSAGDVFVSSEVVPREGPRARVDWRVRGRAGDYKIIDVLVEGVSMAITQRSEFSSVIQRSGGKVSGLLTELRKKVPPK